MLFYRIIFNYNEIKKSPTTEQRWGKFAGIDAMKKLELYGLIKM